MTDTSDVDSPAESPAEFGDVVELAPQLVLDQYHAVLGDLTDEKGAVEIVWTNARGFHGNRTTYVDVPFRVFRQFLVAAGSSAGRAVQLLERYPYLPSARFKPKRSAPGPWVDVASSRVMMVRWNSLVDVG